jgi:hypothetical protein
VHGHSFFFEQGRFIVLAAVENSDDIYTINVHIERDGDALSIAGKAETGANVIAPVSTAAEDTQAFTVRHDAVGETLSDFRGRLRSNIAIQLNELRFGLGREDNGVRHYPFLASAFLC